LLAGGNLARTFFDFVGHVLQAKSQIMDLFQSSTIRRHQFLRQNPQVGKLAFPHYSRNGGICSNQQT
jgi:hypothetical protein